MSTYSQTLPANATSTSLKLRAAHAILLVIYAAILLRDIREPWTGLHDWNGAFYSQLARNLLRYPFDMHHGLPVAAVGNAVPGDGEWSFYATHPPGLVWCIAASFRLFGEHEWAARLVPILASLGTLLLLCGAVYQRYGPALACAAGAIYALLPMAGYFGRMPDQETPCLFLMLAAALAADRHLHTAADPAPRLRPGFVWSVCIAAAIWMDWVAIILAALVSLRAVLARIRSTITTGLCMRIIAAPAAATILLFVYLLHFGFAGRAADLIAVFTARAGVTVGAAGPSLHAWTPWTNTVDNLTLPVILLSIVGLALACRQRTRSSGEQPVGTAWPDGLALVAITGLIWVAIFWRQYLVHQYWLYYLGPAIAILSGRGLLSIYRRIASVAPGAARLIFAGIAVATVTTSHFTMTDLHKRVHCSMADIDAWKTARQKIVLDLGYELRLRLRPPPVLLVKSPVQIERRGSYSFRNIVPPQFAYYFDLPFHVEADLDRLARLLPDASGLLMPTRFAVDRASELSARFGNVEHQSLGTWELFKYYR